jgi:hypothetical protein
MVKPTLRAVDVFRETKFKEELMKQITMTKFQTVESLVEAERIVEDDPRVATNDSLAMMREQDLRGICRVLQSCGLRNRE